MTTVFVAFRSIRTPAAVLSIPKDRSQPWWQATDEPDIFTGSA
ncbi:hypothetical protein [Ciceribacter selenitireducens]